MNFNELEEGYEDIVQTAEQTQKREKETVKEERLVENIPELLQDMNL